MHVSSLFPLAIPYDISLSTIWRAIFIGFFFFVMHTIRRLNCLVMAEGMPVRFISACAPRGVLLSSLNNACTPAHRELVCRLPSLPAAYLWSCGGGTAAAGEPWLVLDEFSWSALRWFTIFGMPNKQLGYPTKMINKTEFVIWNIVSFGRGLVVRCHDWCH